MCISHSIFLSIAQVALRAPPPARLSPLSRVRTRAARARAYSTRGARAARRRAAGRARLGRRSRATVRAT